MQDCADVRLNLLWNLPRILEGFIAKGSQVKWDSFVRIVRLKDKNKPIRFVVAQGI